MSKLAHKNNLRQHYLEEVRPKLQKELGIKNIMAVPELKKILIHVGIGNIMTKGNKDYESVLKNIELIAGQKPVVTKAKKAISNFKTREGMPVGIVATLRGERMYDFFNKFINIVLPRVRDFRGLGKKGFDQKGNFSIGLTEQTVFPEINVDDIVKLHGLQITFCSSSKNKEQGMALLKEFKFPFKKD
ncbi:MAG: 50S ribosomal protein L5 [Patescibacteria group bacterium]